MAAKGTSCPHGNGTSHPLEASRLTSSASDEPEEASSLLLPEGAQIPVETELELHVSDWLRLMEGTGGGSEGRGLPTPKLEVFGFFFFFFLSERKPTLSAPEVQSRRSCRCGFRREGGFFRDAGSGCQGLGIVREDREFRGGPEAGQRAAQLRGHGPGDPGAAAVDHHGPLLEQRR